MACPICPPGRRANQDVSLRIVLKQFENGVLKLLYNDSQRAYIFLLR